MTLADEIRALVRESLCAAVAHRRRLLAKGAIDVEKGVANACNAEGGVLARAVRERIAEQTRLAATESGRFITAPESGVQPHASPT